MSFRGGGGVLSGSGLRSVGGRGRVWAITGITGVIALMLVLAACDDATSTPTLIPTATPTLAPPPPTATPTPSVKQELRVNLGGEPGTLDPQRASTLPEFTVIRQVFQGLLGWAYPRRGADAMTRSAKVLSIPRGHVRFDGSLIRTTRGGPNSAISIRITSPSWTAPISW